jgi:hypothetical protein
VPPQRRPAAGRRPGGGGSGARRPAARKAPAGAAARTAAPPAAPPAPRVPDPLATPPRPVPSGVERLLVIAGTVVALALSVVTAVWEVFLSPLYWGAVPLPVAPLLAAATTLGLIWFTRTVTGSTGLALLPGTVWFVVMVAATMPRHNGSLLLPGVAWMGLVAVLVGSACWTVAAYRLILRRPSVG